MKGKFLEKLTVAPLFKFPTFNYNLPLFIVFIYILQFDVIVIWGSLVYLHGWLDMCVLVWWFLGGKREVIISITSSIQPPVCTGAEAALIMNGYFPPRPANPFIAWCCYTHWIHRLWQTALLCLASDPQALSVRSSVLHQSTWCLLRTCHSAPTGSACTCHLQQNLR